MARKVQKPAVRTKSEPPVQAPTHYNVAPGIPYELVPIDLIEGDLDHPNAHALERIRSAIRRGTPLPPIYCWLKRANDQVWICGDGHHRFIASKEAGFTHIPVTHGDLGKK